MSSDPLGTSENCVAKMSSYSDKLDDIVNSTHVGLALTLSKDVGILQVLLDAREPLTSHEIAGERDLKERYVRELLGSLATAELIYVSTNEAGTLVYHLQEDEKKAYRTTRTMAFISFPKSLMKAYDGVKSILSKSGPFGIRLSSEFHDFIEEYGPYNFDQYMQAIMKSVDGLKKRLESGIDVLEVGCGRGRLLAKFAQMFPQSNFTASDNVDALKIQQNANLGHLPNVQYDFIDLCSPNDLPLKQYDWIYCVNVIHDVPNPAEALKTIRNMLKPGGTFTMIDFATSGSPIGDRGNMYVACLYAVSSFMSVAESFQQEDSHAMGVCWGKQAAINIATAAGFRVKAVGLEYPMTLFVCERNIPEHDLLEC